MKLTPTQFRWLQWMDRNGGKAIPKGLKLAAGGDETNTGAAISFINLVAKGAVVGENGYLVITDYGRRLLTP